MSRSVSGVLSFVAGAGLAVWAWHAPKTFSTAWAFCLALAVATGGVAALYGLWRMVPLRFLARREPGRRLWEDSSPPDDPALRPPAPKA